jgi:microcystin-dependent protein
MSEGQSSAPGAGLGRLTESEAKLVAKLLSDPTYFPIEFRTWLKQFVEGSGIIITASQVQGGQGTNLATGLPPGLFVACAGSSALPVDCLVCDGSAKLRADYPLLFNAIGSTWGAGDGSTTFNIPDLRDRSLYGAGGAVGLGQTDGVAFGSRGGPAHHHDINQSTNNQGSHTHSVSGSTSGVGDHNHFSADAGTTPFALANGSTVVVNSSSGTSRYLVTNYQGGTSQAGAHSHSFSGSTDSQGSHNHNLSGPTSGGYGSDRASYAGVLYAITIGTAA